MNRRHIDKEASHEHAPTVVDVFAVLDMDRTLLDTAAVTERLCRQLERHGVSSRQVDSDLRFIEAQVGQSFSLLDFLEAQYGSELFSVVKQEVQEQVELGEFSEGLLCDGASELLESLENSGVPFAVLTYGEQANQDFKLSLLRNLLGRSTADLHAVVTEVPNKASWIAEEWAHDDGFTIPAVMHASATLIAREIVVIDDKLANLTSGDRRIWGILVDNTGTSRRTTLEVAKRLNERQSLTKVARQWRDKANDRPIDKS